MIDKNTFPYPKNCRVMADKRTGNNIKIIQAIIYKK